MNCVYRSTHGGAKQAENSTASTNSKELSSRNETIGKGNRKSKSTSSQRRTKQVLRKKKLYGKEWNDEGKLCLCIPPRVLNLVTSTLSPQRYTLKHLSGCTMILTRTDSSTEGNSPKALSVDPASSSERKTVCISTSFTRDKV